MPVGMSGWLVYQPRQVAPPGASEGSRRVQNFFGSASGLPPTGPGRQGKAMATTTGTAEPEAQAAGEGVRRRDFINIAAVSFAGAGGIAALVPLISQMAPSKDVLAESTT